MEDVVYPDTKYYLPVLSIETPLSVDLAILEFAYKFFSVCQNVSSLSVKFVIQICAMVLKPVVLQLTEIWVIKLPYKYLSRSIELDPSAILKILWPFPLVNNFIFFAFKNTVTLSLIVYKISIVDCTVIELLYTPAISFLWIKCTFSMLILAAGAEPPTVR